MFIPPHVLGEVVGEMVCEARRVVERRGGGSGAEMDVPQEGERGK